MSLPADTEPDSLHGLLRSSAARDPDHPAFVREGQATSFGELDRASGHFAAALRRLGVGRGDRVALALETSVEYLVAFYGILKAGGAVVPLCPDTRTATLCRALSHSEARAVILEGTAAGYLSGQASSVPSLGLVITVGPPRIADPGGLVVVAFEELACGSDEHHDSGSCGPDLAALVYTSGTTGLPKGVMLAHRNLVANIRSIVGYLGLRPDDSVAMVLPPYYVYGNSVLHTHVCAGATVVAAGSMTFPASVLSKIAQHRCTGLSGVPSTFARLISLTTLDKYDLDSLRYITQAGAAMTPALAAKLQERFPRTKIYVMYGQAEAAARLSYLPPEDLARKAGSAGKAIPGITLRILGPDGRELPPGTVGEIVAQGDSVMQGYWKDPEATARALRPEGLRTGDLGRMDGEGFLYIVGRETEMIKSGAHRIGPKEIEEVIEQLPEVNECAVVGVPDELLGEAIVAFVVRAPKAEVSPQRISRWCLECLPRFKVPAHVLLVDELPRTQTGKVRRIELASWFATEKRGD